MTRRNRVPMSIGQQFRFLGGFSRVIIGLSVLAIFLVWKKVECSRLRAELFKLETQCTSLLAQNEQLSASRMHLGRFSEIRGRAERELGMVMPGGDPDWIVVSASRVVRGGSLPTDGNGREGEPYDDPGGTVACIR